MKCPTCKLVEMIVDRIEEENVVYKCRKCGETATEPLPEESN